MGDATKRAFGEPRIATDSVAALGSEAAADAWGLEQPEPAHGWHEAAGLRDGAPRLSGPRQTAARGTQDAKRRSAGFTVAADHSMMTLMPL
jgi:hypothetical protein